MSDRDVTNVLEPLVGDIDGEAADWDDVLERAAALRRRRSWHPHSRYLLAAAAVGVAAVVALAVAEPWKGGPSILDRAAAAILTPSPQQILYERIALRSAGLVPQGPTVHIQAWVDGGRTHAFRIRGEGPPPQPDPRKPYPAGPLIPYEIGGGLGSADGLSYSFTDRVLYPSPFFAPVTKAIVDPAEYVKKSLTSGRAMIAGTTTIHGRRVVRIRIAAGALFFVDARTYRPVRIELSAVLPFSSRIHYPLGCLAYTATYGCGTYPQPHAMWVYDFEAYRYLPRTAANRKLTSIRAMHPTARIV